MYKLVIRLGRAYDLPSVLVELDFGKGLDEDLYENDGILVAGADTLHEARIAYAPLVLDILQLGDVDAGRARRGRRQGKALAHGGQSGAACVVCGRREAQCSF